MPVVPVLLYFAVRGVATGAARIGPAARRAAVALAIGALVVHPLYLSVRLLDDLDDDTRLRAGQLLTGPRERMRFEPYTPGSRDVWSAAALDLEQLARDSVRYVIASSFMYGRFELADGLGDTDEDNRERLAKYRRLFEYPYVEVRPGFRTFAFSNPVIRIIDLQGRRGPP
jgi:hypothetical protein